MAPLCGWDKPLSGVGVTGQMMAMRMRAYIVTAHVRPGQGAEAVLKDGASR